MWVTIIKHGVKDFRMDIDVGDEDGQPEKEGSAETRTEEENGCDPKPSEEKGMPKNLGELRDRICEQTGCDNSTMRLIHKGKYIVAPMERPLSELNLKADDKILVMGIAPKQNPGIVLLSDYEKVHLVKLIELFKTNGDDITELERNFLEGEVLDQMLKRMDKRLKQFTETALRHLEAIDALDIYGEGASEEGKCRSREKRKCLVDGIQTLLRDNDKYAFRLQQYRKSLHYK
uniref:BAG domain-containing protein n=1 Tax=Globodera rostochiensis TaxID=31243 RepID=A0A914HE14_GLORO